MDLAQVMKPRKRLKSRFNLRGRHTKRRKHSRNRFGNHIKTDTMKSDVETSSNDKLILSQ